MAERILVINPNSSEETTRAIDAAAAPLRFPGGPLIDCLTLAEGPPAIESQSDADFVVAPLCQTIRRLDPEAGAFVIACFSDPGLFSAREQSRKPVLGIAECGILAALSLGERFGVISILARALPRHLRYVRAMGVRDRFAGDLPIGLGVAALADEQQTWSRLVETAAKLREEQGADVLVLGCAGMTRYRARLEAAAGIPVVEPTGAAIAMAIARLALGWGQTLGPAGSSTASLRTMPDRR